MRVFAVQKKVFPFAAVLLFCAGMASGNDFDWKGNIDSDWSNSSNWIESGSSTSNIPSLNDDVTIYSGASFYPVLSADSEAKEITIQNFASLDLFKHRLELKDVVVEAGGTLDINGGTLTAQGVKNGGLLRITQGGTFDITSASNGGSSTVEYYGGTGASSSTVWNSGNYENLIVNANLIVNELTVTGVSTIEGSVIATHNSQTYDGTVTLTGAGTLSANKGVQFNSALEGGSYNLDIIGVGLFGGTVGIGTLSVSDSADFQGDVIADAVFVGSSTTINTNTITITTRGSQTYTGPVTFYTAGTLTSMGGGTITLGNTLYGNNNNIGISGNGVFTGNVNNIGTLSITDGEVTANEYISADSLDIKGRFTQLAGKAVTLGGSLAMNGGTYTAGAGGTTSVAGDWVITGGGTFAHGNGSVVFGGTSIVGGSNSFYNVTVDVGGSADFAGTNSFNNLTISGSAVFPSGGTQFVDGSFSLGTAGTMTASTSGSRMILDVAVGSAFIGSGAVISNVESVQYLGLDPAGINHGNTKNIFKGGTYTWTGGSNTDWNEDGNWDVGAPPNASDTSITIPDSKPRYPILNIAGTAGTITIGGSASLNLGSQTLNAGSITAGGTLDISAGTLDATDVGNNGLLRITQGGTLNITSAVNGGSSTVEYYGGAGSSSSTVWNGGNYQNLVVDTNLDAGGTAINVGGSLSTSMNLTAGDLTVTTTSTIGGSVTTVGGSQTYTGAVTFSTAGTLTSGGTITLGSTLDGGNNNIGISGNGVFKGDVNNIGTLSITVGEVTANEDIRADSLDIKGKFTQLASKAVTLGGSLAMNGGTYMAGSGGTTTIGGDWIPGGIFAHGNGSVVFGGTSSVDGSNSFYNLAIEGSAVFPSGGTQVVDGSFSLGTAGTMTAAGGSRMILEVGTGSAFIGSGAVISNVESVNYLGLDPTGINHSNTKNIFKGGTYTWSGATDTDWDKDSNWVYGVAPPQQLDTNILIPDVSPSINYPVMNIAGTAGTITIDSGASLNLGSLTLNAGSITVGGTLDINAGTLDATYVGNNGLLRITQGGTFDITVASNSVPSTVEYYGGASSTVWNGGNYQNLVVDANLDAGGTAINVGGSLSTNANLTAGTLSVTGISELGANVTTAGGSQSYMGTVTLSGGGGTLTAGTVNFDAAIIGGANSLNVSGVGLFGGTVGIGSLYVGSNAVFGGAVSAGTLFVDGTSLINTSSITTNSGGSQTYTGAVTLGTAGTLTSMGGGTITLGSTLYGNNNNIGISGNGVFKGDVNNIGTLSITFGEVTANENLSANSLDIKGKFTQAAGKAVTLGGSLAMNGGTYMAGSGGTTTIGGDWIPGGIFAHGNGSVVFGGTSIVDGSNSFYNLAIEGSAVFPSGGTQGVTGSFSLTSGGTMTASTGGSRMILSVGTNSASIAVGGSISNVESVNYLGLDPAGINHSNTKNIFRGGTYTWSGATDTDWDKDSNWEDGVAPPQQLDTSITIPDSKPRYPILNIAGTAGTITINGNASLNLGGTIFTAGSMTVEAGGTLDINAGLLSAGTVTNNGIIQMHGLYSQISPPASVTNQTGSTVLYYGTGSALGGLASFYNLEIAGGSHATVNAIDARGTLNITGGTLSLSAAGTAAGSITVGGKLDIGQWNLGGGTSFVLTGTLESNGGTISSAGIFSQPATASVIGGTLSINAVGGITTNGDSNTVSKITLNDIGGGVIDFTSNAPGLTVGGASTAGSLTITTTDPAGGSITLGGNISGGVVNLITAKDVVRSDGTYAASTFFTIKPSSPKSIGAGTTTGTPDILIAREVLENISAGTITVGDNTNTTEIHAGTLSLTDKYDLNFINYNNNITFYSTVVMGAKKMSLNVGTGSVIQNGPDPAISAASGGGLVLDGAVNVGGSGTPLLTSIPHNGLSGAALTNIALSTLYISNAGSLSAPSIWATNAVYLGAQGGSLTVDDITADIGAGTVTLSSSDAINQTGVITAALLAGSSGAGLTLTSSNNVGTVSLINSGASGDIRYNSSGGFTLTGGSNSAVGGSVTITGTVINLNFPGGTFTAGNTGTFTFAGPVNLAATSAVSAGNGKITFNNTINGANNDLTLDAGTGSILFGGTVGTSLPLGKIDIKSNVNGNALTINAGTLSLGRTGGSISVNSNNADIKFKVDGLTHNSGTTIDAGAANVTLAPLTSNRTVGYGDDPSGLITDIKYTSLWNNIIASSFTVGDADTGNITVSETGTNSVFGGNGVGYNLTLQNAGTSAIDIDGNYLANNKSLSLITAPSGSGGSVTITAGGSVTLGGGTFNVYKNTVGLNGAGTVTINAVGGINFGVTGTTPIISNITALTGTPNLKLNSGVGHILINGAVGAIGGSIGNIIVSDDAGSGVGAENITLNGGVYSTGDFRMLHSGTLSLNGSVFADGGFHQNTGISPSLQSIAKVVLGGGTTTTTTTAGTIQTASTSSIDINSDMIIYYDTLLNETAGGYISTKNIFADYKLTDMAWKLDVTTTPAGTITINGNIGIDIEVAGKRKVGAVTLSGGKITNGSIWTKNDPAVAHILGSVSVMNAGTWTLKDAGSTNNPVYIITSGAAIRQIGSGANNIFGNTTLSTGTYSTGSSIGYANGGGSISLQGALTRDTSNVSTLTFDTLGNVSVAAIGTFTYPLGDVTVNGAGTYSMGDDLYSSLLVFKGDTNTDFNSGDKRVPDVRITHATSGGAMTGVKVITNNVTQATSQLEIQQGILDLDSRNWALGGSSTLQGFHAVGGTLTLGSAGSASILTGIGSFRTDSGVNIDADNTYESTLKTGGSVSVAVGTQGNISKLSIVMNGGVSSAHTGIYMGTNSAFTAEFKNFELQGTGSTGYVEALSDLKLNGNWTISGTSSAPPNVPPLPLTGSPPGTQRFFPGGSASARTVEFTGSNIEISGNTFWYNLKCGVGGATIKFSNYPDVHTIDGEMQIKGTSPNKITLTRKDDITPPTPQPSTPYTWPPSGVGNIFWVINLAPDTDGTLAYENLDVWYSYAYTGDVITNSTITSPWLGNYCIKWTNLGDYVYCFTEDAFDDDGNPGGNGKIDRIRVQASEVLTGNFSGFKVAFQDGYEVDTNRIGTTNGFVVVSDGSGTMFYIYLKEKDYPDTGAIPVWRISENTTLLLGGNLFTLPQNFNLPIPNSIMPVDTAPPRISYTLSIAGRAEVFVHFTELVQVATVPAAGNLSSKTITGLTPVDTVQLPYNSTQTDYASQYLIKLNEAFSANDLINGITFEEAIFINVTDVPPVPFGWPQPLGEPIYPYDYDYKESEYFRFSKPLNPSNYPDKIALETRISQPNGFRQGKLSTYNGMATHRVTDLLIMVKPASGDDPHLSMWPLYARDIGGVQGASPGIAQIFNGSEQIRNSDISVESVVKNSITLVLDPGIIFDINIPDEYKVKAPVNNEGLWLPKALNIAPKKFETLNDQVTSYPENNYVGTIPGDAMNEDGMLEFVFDISYPSHSSGKGSLYGVRLDAAAGNIPDDWYKKLVNFKIQVRGLVYQRSGATITNNVINPTIGEKAVLNYILDRSGPVTVQVFTMDGNLVQQLYRGVRTAGEYVAVWDGKNRGGNVVARGMYFIRIVAPDIDEIRKVMVVK